MSEVAIATRPSEAFIGRIEPTRTSFFYTAGLAVVALAMVLLPLIYVAMIVGVGKLLWWHAVNDTAIFDAVSGRGVIFALLVYLGPIVAGGILLVFLVKPLFARAPKRPKPFVLKESEDPEVFAFVRRICRVVGAPVPREIHADCQVNASASFRRGWISFFGRDLVLTVGMPLVAGMTTRQLAGVLAHEFGHFAQGAGMRLTFVIRSVNFWFARVVHERDAWDERLEDWAATEDWRLKIVFLVAKGGVWLSRRVLWVLMQAGHAISCFMSRQMEFDADSYEAKVAGSDEFPRTSERIRLLSAASAAAMHDARSTFQRNELPDDFPGLVLWREQRMPDDVRTQVMAERDAEKTHWAQTHPCERDRIRAAATLAAPGVFHLEEPATILFADWPTRTREVTRHFYQYDQELPVEKLTLRPTDGLLADREAEDDSGTQLTAFFGEDYPVLRLGALPEATPADHAAALATFRQQAPEVRRLAGEADTLTQRLHKQQTGFDVIRAGFKFTSYAPFELQDGTLSAVPGAIEQTQRLLRQTLDELALHDAAALRRLAAALAFLGTQPDDTPEKAARRTALVSLHTALARSMDEVDTILQSASSLQLILQNADRHPDGRGLERTARDVARRALDAWTDVMKRLGPHPHPYTATQAPIGATIHPFAHGDDEFARALKTASACSDSLLPLTARILGELSGQALQAEARMASTEPATPAH